MQHRLLRPVAVVLAAMLAGCAGASRPAMPRIDALGMPATAQPVVRVDPVMESTSQAG